MDGFTQKLRLIFKKIFNEDIDKFTEEFIDRKKIHTREHKSQKDFFFNRKTVLRRWLKNEISCTPDFQKSFKNYKISYYQFKGEALFTLEDFKREDNLEEFDKKIELYLLYKQKVYVNKEYQYIYTFCEDKKEIECYTIVDWAKGKESEIIIHLNHKENDYQGTFLLKEDNNLFISIKIGKVILYMLFHDNNDSSCPYIVGTSMGYLAKDNKVPYAQKVIFSKEKLNSGDISLEFILNETESIFAIENRLNLNSKEVKINHFVKYSNRFKKYHSFFNRLISKNYFQHFYYRLAFREFYTFFRLFERFSKEETYFIMNYESAFYEAIQTVEAIKNIPFQVVMPLNEENIFFATSAKELKIKNRFLNLATYGVNCTLIFIVDNDEELSQSCKNLLSDLTKEDIELRIVNKNRVEYKVNSLNFFFIRLEDDRDFVLADPIRDNKDVFKLFINSVTLDEYQTDYYRIFKESNILKNNSKN